MESPSRIFLGWDRPALQSTVDSLLHQRPDGDLADFLVVTPGGRAARLLLGELLERTQMLSPPQFCTPGQLADFLIPPSEGAEAAGPLMRRLAWVAALQSLGGASLEPLVPAVVRTGSAGLRAWWQIAAMLETAQSELAGELILFEDVPERASDASLGVAGFPDAARWEAAGKVQREYERLLTEAGLIEPELRVLRSIGATRDERSVGAATGGRGGTELEFSRVVLVGVADLGRGARELLRRLAHRAPGSVVSLVFAPESLSDRFDEFGAVLPAAWRDAQLDLPEVQFAEGPGDQAQVALEVVAAFGGRYAAHQIVIGMPDEEVQPFIERKAEQAAAVEVKAGRSRPQMLRVRAAAGVPLDQTAPLRLLQVIGEFVAEQSFSSLAAVVRHPDIEEALLRLATDEERGPANVEWWLDTLDQYQGEHVPGRLSGEWHSEDPEEQRTLSRLHAMVGELAGTLLTGPERRRLSEWAAPIRDLMRRIYGDLKLSRNDPTQRRTIEGNLAIRDMLLEFDRAASVTGPLVFECTAQEAIEIVLEIAGTGAVPDEGDEETVELLGWLELPLDPAPVAIVTGLNEGRVPSTTVGESMLPDALREAIGAASNRRRYARDLFNLAAIAASRKHVALIAGRRALDNSPLAPSRLLFACDPEVAVHRVRRFTGDEPSDRPRIRIQTRITPGETSQFHEMPLVPTEPVTSMRVTSFRTFLASPYLFYLEQILRLEERDDACLELDPLHYGSMMHEVLERFGNSDVRHSPDETVIENCLLDKLATIERARFGVQPPTCIWLQLEFARRRLREFAQFQAERRRNGWLIEHTEWMPSQGPAAFVVDGEPFGLRGKIDRIERHETSNVWAVLDYKTGDSVKEPGIAHRGIAGWRDLQLPLYRHLAAELSLPADPERLILGYIPLAKKPGCVKVMQADWDMEALAEADEAAREVVRRVRAGQFLDLGHRPPEDGILGTLAGVGFIGGGRRSSRGEMEEQE